MICWLCKRDLSWEAPAELTLAEREACDDCRPSLTAARATLAAAVLEESRPVNTLPA